MLKQASTPTSADAHPIEAGRDLPAQEIHELVSPQEIQPAQVNEQLQVRLFGSCQVRIGDTLITHWPRKDALQLLKLLAVQVHHRIQRAQAARLLWPDDEVRPEQRLNNAVYMLRKALQQNRQQRGESRYIATENDTISFAKTAQVWTDVEAFERLLDVATPDPNCTSELMQATELYAGHLLFEDEPASWCLYAREHLKQRYMWALRTLATRQHQQGHAELAIESLRRLVEVQPTDEVSHRTLITILIQCGRHQEARGQYEECRAALASELGTTPSPQTREAVSSRVSTDIATVSSASTGSGSNVPVLAPARRLRLPVAMQTLIGRQVLLHQLTESIRTGHRAVTLSGPGGVGKTLLALHLAHLLQAEFADGACFVQLSDVLDAQAVPGILARAFHVEMDSNKNWERALAEFLQDKQLLLVLDNFEHLLEAAPLVSWMLSIAPRLHVVCTSRSMLRINGEHLCLVPPLALPDPQCVDVATLANSPAVRLFVERAKALDNTFELTADNAADVKEICHRLDGLPLAMELAAARLRLLGLRALHERLQSSFDLLSGGCRDSPNRHRSLDAVLQWSYELLPADVQTVFRALGMFAGGTTVAHAEAVIDLPASTISDAMDQLLDQNLLFVDPEPASSHHTDRRLRMLQTVRSYALHQLEQLDLLTSQQRRFTKHWADIAEHIYKQRTSGQYRLAIDMFDREFVNFEMAIHWASRNDRGLSHQFVATLAAFWGRRGFASEFFVWSRSHLDLNESHQTSHWYATACYATGILSFAVGDYNTGQPYIEKALQVSRESGQASLELLALGHLAVLEYVHGHVEKAMALNEQAILFANQTGETRSSANIVMNLGEMHLTMGNYDQAQECFNHGLTHKHLLTQSRPSILYFYLYLQARIRGDSETARAHGQQSVITGRNSKDPRALGWMLTWNAEFHALMNELENTKELLEAAALLNKKVGDAALQCLHSRATGIYYLLKGDNAKAIQCLESSLEQSVQTGFLLDCDNVLLWSLRAYRLSGQFSQADAMLQRLFSNEFVLHHYLIPSILEEAALLLTRGSEPVKAQLSMELADALRKIHHITRSPADEKLLMPAWPATGPSAMKDESRVALLRQTQLSTARGDTLVRTMRDLLFTSPHSCSELTKSY